jgi:CAAX protease family protein
VTTHTFAANLLFAFLLVVAPAWDYYDTRRLKQSPTTESRVRYYRALCLWLWLAAAVAIATTGWRSILFIAPAPGEAPWLFQHAWAYYVVGAAIALLTAAVVLPYITVLRMSIRKQPRKYESAKLMQQLSYAYLFPTTHYERRWWVVVALTAGIAEEILFRGFALRYLHTSPWHIDLTLAMLASCVVFGLQHLYQGWKGAVTTGLMGAVLALLFLVSGSLLLPMLLHAAMDLRLLIILPPSAK